MKIEYKYKGSMPAQCEITLSEQDIEDLNKYDIVESFCWVVQEKSLSVVAWEVQNLSVTSSAMDYLITLFDCENDCLVFLWQRDLYNVLMNKGTLTCDVTNLSQEESDYYRDNY